jgi:hypothetical protein
MLKPMLRVYYEYQGQKLTLNKLYAAVRKKRGRANILASVLLGIGKHSEQVSVKIVFIRYIMLALESRNGEDLRTIGNLFCACCDELETSAWRRRY